MPLAAEEIAKYLVAAAVWAPSVHNTQPWRFTAGGRQVRLSADAGRQARWQELSKSECFELLAREHLGRVAVVDDRGPVVFPVNYVLDRHMVVFRTDEGTKLDAACWCSRVAFEVDGTDAAAHTGWSVLVRGEVVEVTDPEELARLCKLRLDPWAPGAKAHYVRILPAVLTGRRIWAPGGPPHQPGNHRPGGAARRRR